MWDRLSPFLTGDREDHCSGPGGRWNWREHHVFSRLLRMESRIQLVPSPDLGPTVIPTPVQVHRSHHRSRASDATHLQSPSRLCRPWAQGQGAIRSFRQNRPIKAEDSLLDKDHKVSSTDQIRLNQPLFLLPPPIPLDRPSASFPRAFLIGVLSRFPRIVRSIDVFFSFFGRFF